MMPFASALNEYFDTLCCTNKDVALRSGISASAISRYRSGERIPEVGGKSIVHLSQGLALIHQDKNLPECPTAEEIQSVLEHSIISERMQALAVCERVNDLMMLLNIRNNELSAWLEIDPSYLSRIRSKQRTPADLDGFARKCAQFVADKCTSPSVRASLLTFIGSNAQESSDIAAEVESWLLG